MKPDLFEPEILSLKCEEKKNCAEDQILSAAGWFSSNIGKKKVSFNDGNKCRLCLMSSTSVKGKGDVVAISLPNIPQYLVPALGTIHAGTVFVSIEVSFKRCLGLQEPLGAFPKGCWKKIDISCQFPSTQRVSVNEG